MSIYYSIIYYNYHEVFPAVFAFCTCVCVCVREREREREREMSKPVNYKPCQVGVERYMDKERKLNTNRSKHTSTHTHTQALADRYTETLPNTRYIIMWQ